MGIQDPGSRMEKILIRDQGSRMQKIFDPGSGIWDGKNLDPGSRIRDKHPGSEKTGNFVSKFART
jgi:hypothetical protein